MDEPNVPRSPPSEVNERLGKRGHRFDDLDESPPRKRRSQQNSSETAPAEVLNELQIGKETSEEEHKPSEGESTEYVDWGHVVRADSNSSSVRERNRPIGIFRDEDTQSDISSSSSNSSGSQARLGQQTMPKAFQKSQHLVFNPVPKLLAPHEPGWVGESFSVPLDVVYTIASRAVHEQAHAESKPGLTVVSGHLPRSRQSNLVRNTIRVPMEGHPNIWMLVLEDQWIEHQRGLRSIGHVDFLYNEGLDHPDEGVNGNMLEDSDVGGDFDDSSE